MISARKPNRYHLALLAVLLLFTLFEELYLRRWLWSHYGSKSILAGSLPNFLAVLVLGVGLIVIKPPREGKSVLRPIAAIVAGLTLYEIAQIWMPNRTFDWNDLFATILGGVVCWLLLA
jgi:glycopeptide antibiotics resistance protein